MPHRPNSTMSSTLIVVVLAMMLGLQPVTTDLYLPALPQLVHDLGASMPQAQLTLTALLLAFGISQLVWGPISDRFGRKPVLLTGSAFFSVASAGVALSPTIESLLVWRALQGVAMGAGVMCARAIVRDLYAPAQGATVMSKGLSGLAVIACISPPLGGWLTSMFGWHAALAILALYGLGAVLLIAMRFEETVPVKNPQALHLKSMVRTWGQIAINPVFLAFSSLAVSSYCGLFTFLATSSFVLIRVLGLSTTQYGFVLLMNSFLYLTGTVLCRRVLPRLGVRRAVSWAGGLTLASGTLMALLSLVFGPSLWSIVAPMTLFFIGHGIHQPCSQSGAVGPFPQAAGAASALNGFFMMIFAFAMGHWLGTHMDGSAYPLIFGIWFWCVLTAMAAWTLVRRYAPT